MTTLFISHSSADKKATDELAARLEEKQFLSLFLDHDQETGIVAGHSWERTLYRKLRACTGVIVLWSENYAASRWCFAEVAVARMLGKQIFPLIINPCEKAELPSILAETQYVDLRSEPEPGYERLWRGLEQAGIETGSSGDWNPNDSPYPGLDSFTIEQSGIFFGRSEETRLGIEALSRLRRRGSPRMLLVLGPSGSGKSSLALAGLLPRLRRAGAEWLVIEPFRPKTEPLAELATAIADTAGLNWREVRESLRGEGGLAALLRDLARDLGRERRNATPLLVIDQLEEALGQRDSSESVRRFQDLVAGALESEDGPLVMATLRSDYLGALQQAPVLGKAEFEPLTIGPMERHEMREAIVEPARLGQIELEDGLAERLLDDTGGTDALPLLAFTLSEMWTRYREDRKFTITEYKDLGGIQGAIAMAAEAAYKDAVGSGSDEALRRSFLRLARPAAEGSGFARRTVLWENIEPDAKPMLECFVTERLLVAQGGEDQPRTVEVAHEALFRSWKKLEEWLEDSRADLQLHRRLAEAAGEWQSSGRRSDFKWSNERALEVRRALDRLGLRPTDTESDFLGPTDPAEMAELLGRADTGHDQRRLIGSRLEILGDERPGVGLRDDGVPEIAWCAIPGGEVSARFTEEYTADPASFPEGHQVLEEVFEPGMEYLQQVLGYRITLPAYEIARYPVTWRQFEAFSGAEDYADPQWWSNASAMGAGLTRASLLFGNEPVTAVSWFEAAAFCRWLSARSGETIRLPTIWEWERAARGDEDDRRYAWGNDWAALRANTIENGLGRATAVGMYPAGASPFGVMDMCGGVWDWCADTWGLGPYYPGDEPDNEEHNRPVRGGSWNHVATNAQTGYHENSDAPDQRYFDVGFRVLRVGTGS